MIRLVGPGGAGKSTIGVLLAEHLGVAFVDLDRHLAARVGDISEYISSHGYDVYARENVEAYCSLLRAGIPQAVIALSSGFMTYPNDTHLEYGRVCRELTQHPRTFVLLPSLDREVCVAETVRRQIARPFGRSPAKEEAVIRARFETYMAVPVRKIETMRPVKAVVDEIAAASTAPGVSWPGRYVQEYNGARTRHTSSDVARNAAVEQRITPAGCVLALRSMSHAVEFASETYMPAISLRRSLHRLLSPFLRVAARFVRRESAWERVTMRVPESAFGPGSHLPFAEYFAGESGVRVGSIDDIVAWLQTCEYVTDLELFQQRDFWQHPGAFERLRRGDCEDFALWAWRKLAELGIDAEFCVGRVICDDRPEIDRQHAWVVYRVNGTAFLFEPAARTPSRMIRPLADAMGEYVPHFAVNHRFDTSAFAGCASDLHRGNAPQLQLSRSRS